MRYFRRLKTWSAAHQLALEVYSATADFPKAEIYGLRSQLRRAAMSITGNIAEGSGRRTPADYARFLDMSVGSAAELEAHLELARDLGYVEPGTTRKLQRQCVLIRAMLLSLRRRILDPRARESRPTEGPPPMS